jgi:hypothetical protein
MNFLTFLAILDKKGPKIVPQSGKKSQIRPNILQKIGVFFCYLKRAQNNNGFYNYNNFILCIYRNLALLKA